jgi:mannosyltransferase OCH1-like enzyme
MIPKVLHIVWVGDESKRPDNCIETWRRHHPSWTIKVWGNAEYRRDWVNKAHMDAMWSRELCGVADLMRYEILYAEGGVTVDADSMCQRTLPDWLLEPEAFSCYEQEFCRPGLVQVAFMGAVPRCPFFGQIILDLHREPSVVHKRAWETTGPVRITQTWRDHQYPLTVYPSHYFMPEHYSGHRYRGAGPVFATQLWGSTRTTYDEIRQMPAPPAVP